MSAPPAGPRALWVTSEIHLPPRGGAPIYSQGLMHALARQGFRVTGLGVSDAKAPEDDDVAWDLLSAPRRHPLHRLTSLYPLMTARLPLRQLRDRLDQQIATGYDLVVIDHLMASWSLRPLMRARRRGLVGQIWYASQNDEEAIWRDALSKGGEKGFRRLARAVDYPLVRRAQRRLVQSASLITAITHEDAIVLRSIGGARVEVARPGPPETALEQLPPARERPRSIVVAGSFLWSIKLRNLELFLESSEDVIRESEIGVVVAGRMAAEDRSTLTARFPWVTFRGEVADIRAIYREGRLGVVPEVLGGGFKLKVLDYIYCGLAVAGLRSALTGLPSMPPTGLIAADSMSDLIRAIRVAIDKPEELDAMSVEARRVCNSQFDWDATGREMVRWFSQIESKISSGRALGESS